MLLEATETKYAFMLILTAQIVSVFYNTRLLGVVLLGGSGVVSYANRRVENFYVLFSLFVAGTASLFAGFLFVCEYSTLGLFGEVLGAHIAGDVVAVGGGQPILLQLFVILPWCFLMIMTKTGLIRTEVGVRLEFAGIVPAGSAALRYQCSCFLDTAARSLERFFTNFVVYRGNYDAESFLGDIN